MGRATHDRIWVLKRNGVEIARGKTQEDIYLQTGIGKSVVSSIFRGCYNSDDLKVEKILIPRENVYVPKYKIKPPIDKWCVSQRGDRYGVHAYFSEEVMNEFLQSISSYLGRPVDGYRVISIHDKKSDALKSLRSLQTPQPTPTPTVEAKLFDRSTWLTKGEYHEWQNEQHTCEVCGISGSSAKFHNRHHDKCNGLKMHKGRGKKSSNI